MNATERFFQRVVLSNYARTLDVAVARDIISSEQRTALVRLFIAELAAASADQPD